MSVHHHSLGMGVTSDARRLRLVKELRQSGITNDRVLDAIAKVPRHEFMEEALRFQAYTNTALPIGLAQTISQPYIVALMTQTLLDTGSCKRVLEIGTGSGYQTAVLAELISSVFSVERIRSLSEKARKTLKRLEYRNILFSHTDGNMGWKSYAPYDGIVVTAGAQTIPESLTTQLADGGRMIIPVGPNGAQKLECVTKTGSRIKREVVGPASFVPLLSGRA